MLTKYISSADILINLELEEFLENNIYTIDISIRKGLEIKELKIFSYSFNTIEELKYKINDIIKLNYLSFIKSSNDFYTDFIFKIYSDFIFNNFTNLNLRNPQIQPKLKGGKYKGKTLSYVIEKNFGYIAWAYENTTDNKVLSEKCLDIIESDPEILFKIDYINKKLKREK